MVKDNGGGLSLGWQRALSVINGARRFTFLPGLVMVISAMVCFKRADALSISLNTVAMLFLLEIEWVTTSTTHDHVNPKAFSPSLVVCNLEYSVYVRCRLCLPDGICSNLCYHMGLNHSIRTSMELRGRLEMSEAEVVALDRTKILHIVAISVGIPIAVILAPPTGTGSCMLPAVMMGVCSVIEAHKEVHSSANTSCETKDKPRRCGPAAARLRDVLLGLIAMSALMKGTQGE